MAPRASDLSPAVESQIREQAAAIKARWIQEGKRPRAGRPMPQGFYAAARDLGFSCEDSADIHERLAGESAR